MPQGNSIPNTGPLPANTIILTVAQNTVFYTGTPTLTGRTSANTRVELSIDGVVVGTVISDANGNFSYTPSSSLGLGNHNYNGRIVNADGSYGASASPVYFSIPSIQSVLGTQTGTLTNAGSSSFVTINIAVGIALALAVVAIKGFDMFRKSKLNTTK